MRQSARVGFLLPAFGGVRPDASPLLLDYAQIGLLMPARSFCKTESFLPALALGNLGFSMSPRALSQLGLAASAVGLSRIGSVFSLSVVASAHLGFPLSVQSSARLGSGMPTVRCAAIGSTALLRHHARPEAFYINPWTGQARLCVLLASHQSRSPGPFDVTPQCRSFGALGICDELCAFRTFHVLQVYGALGLRHSNS